MPVINMLSPHLADLIAAGEVVERPASVIKELMENALDAGAKNITVELRGGGSTYIRVTDDGCGMSPEDAGTCFLRHATSKLRDERGLEAICTLGFRGEALAAISAVSRIELRTRARGSGEGTRVTLDAGSIMDMGPAGCPEGTDITIRDLFFNTPARLKFLKSDRAEGAACVLAARCCALGRPDVSVRCIKDGKEEFFSPGDGRAESCVYSVLGREFAAGLIPVSSDDGSVSVTGFTGSPSAARGNRGGQYFFINGRHIRSKTMQAALEQSYKNSLFHGRFPSCALYLSLSPASVDVNVHPTKAEVRFSDERRIFDGVYYACLAALGAEDRTAEISVSNSTRNRIRPSEGFFRQMSAEEFKNRSSSPSGFSAGTAAPRPATVRDDGGESWLSRRAEPGPAYRPEPDNSRPSPADAALPAIPPFNAVSGKPPSAPEPRTPREPLPGGGLSSGEARDMRFHVIGELFRTYIVVEYGDGALLIDKHAAHERVIFDRLKESGGVMMSQSLLTPIVFTPGAGGAELLLENTDTLSRLGFELEAYGPDSVVIRAVPSETDDGDAPAALEELLVKLQAGDPGVRGAPDEIYHTMACKAAVKAGRLSEPGELRELASRVVSGEIRYCPHGRPVSIPITKAELDRRFDRV